MKITNFKKGKKADKNQPITTSTDWEFHYDCQHEKCMNHRLSWNFSVFERHSNWKKKTIMVWLHYPYIHTSPRIVFLFCILPTPLEFPVKLYTFPYKLLLSRPPPPQVITNDHPWGGYGYFLESHIAQIHKSWLGMPKYGYWLSCQWSVKLPLSCGQRLTMYYNSTDHVRFNLIFFKVMGQVITLKMLRMTQQYRQWLEELLTLTIWIHLMLLKAK